MAFAQGDLAGWRGGCRRIRPNEKDKNVRRLEIRFHALETSDTERDGLSRAIAINGLAGRCSRRRSLPVIDDFRLLVGTDRLRNLCQGAPVFRNAEGHLRTGLASFLRTIFQLRCVGPGHRHGPSWSEWRDTWIVLSVQPGLAHPHLPPRLSKRQTVFASWDKLDDQRGGRGSRAYRPVSLPSRIRP